MLDLFKAECLKMKGTKILWLSIIILALTIALEFYSYTGSTKYSIDRDGWNDYFMSVVILINFLTGYMSYYILTCYIYAREYQERTHMALFTSPVRRSRLYFSKLLVIYMYIAVSLLLAFGLSALLGMLITTRPLTFEIVIYQLGIFAKNDSYARYAHPGHHVLRHSLEKICARHYGDVYGYVFKFCFG
ncbi:ABC transporter permease [Paenibacillus polymyxa]|uniref:ABC transporter permease n=1 Tax=Paenibacillus TaxID=44249 RepID=UPI00296E2CBF|nr:ABC transporter permease [Paenibacillus polymyxa]WOZ38334.1 ABC transporter permease [Paenibacillus polymyxa]